MIAGYCAGGTVAFELARRLLAQGSNVALLILFGSPYRTSYRSVSQLKQRAHHMASRVSHHAKSISSLPVAAERRHYVASFLRRHLRHQASDALAEASEDPRATRRKRVEHATMYAVRRYQPLHSDGGLALIVPNENR